MTVSGAPCQATIARTPTFAAQSAQPWRKQWNATNAISRSRRAKLRFFS